MRNVWLLVIMDQLRFMRNHPLRVSEELIRCGVRGVRWKGP